MRTIIAGSRDYCLTQDDWRALDSMQITEVVCGGARGVDDCGRQWAISRGIPVKMFPADWDAHGRSAGPIRNRQMAMYADKLIAFWDGKSRGTRNMIDTAKSLGLEVIVERRNSAAGR
jgi:hypothetical protein